MDIYIRSIAVLASVFVLAAHSSVLHYTLKVPMDQKQCTCTKDMDYTEFLERVIGNNFSCFGDGATVTVTSFGQCTNETYSNKNESLCANAQQCVSQLYSMISVFTGIEVTGSLCDKTLTFFNQFPNRNNYSNLQKAQSLPDWPTSLLTVKVTSLTCTGPGCPGSHSCYKGPTSILNKTTENVSCERQDQSQMSTLSGLGHTSTTRQNTTSLSEVTNQTFSQLGTKQVTGTGQTDSTLGTSTDPTISTRDTSTDPTASVRRTSTVPNASTLGTRTGPTASTLGTRTDPNFSTRDTSTDQTISTQDTRTSPTASVRSTSTFPNASTLGTRTGPTASTLSTRTDQTPLTRSTRIGPTASTRGESTGPTTLTLGTRTGPTASTLTTRTGPTALTRSTRTDPTASTRGTRTGPTASTRGTRTGPTASTRSTRTGPTASTLGTRTDPTALTRGTRTDPTASIKGTTGQTSKTHSLNQHGINDVTDDSSMAAVIGAVLGSLLALLILVVIAAAIRHHVKRRNRVGNYAELIGPAGLYTVYKTPLKTAAKPKFMFR